MKYSESELEKVYKEIQKIDDEFLKSYLPEKNRGEPRKDYKE